MAELNMNQLKALKEERGIKFKAIVAMDKHGAIGRYGKLPWHIPSDLKLFKNSTIGSHVLMGCTTAQSIPDGQLDGRTLHVLSTRVWLNQAYPQTQYHCDLESVLKAVPERQTLWIAGGSQIYKLCEPLTDEMQITHVETTVSGADAFFPVDLKNWYLKPKSQDEFAYKVVNYIRPIVPVVGSKWRHSNGAEYEVVTIANADSVNLADYPVTIVYRGSNGKVWSRPINEWHRSMTLIPEQK